MKKESRITRRSFLGGAVAAAGTTMALPAIVPSSVFGAYSPSNRIVMGAIGVGSQGNGDMRGFLSKPEVQSILRSCGYKIENSSKHSNAVCIFGVEIKEGYKIVDF